MSATPFEALSYAELASAIPEKVATEATCSVMMVRRG